MLSKQNILCNCTFSYYICYNEITFCFALRDVSASAFVFQLQTAEENMPSMCSPCCSAQGKKVYTC